MKMHIDVLWDRSERCYFVVSCEEDDGTTFTRHLTYDQTCAFLANSGVSEKVSCPVGRLPEGYIDALAESDGGGRVKVYVPPQRRTFFLRAAEGTMPMSFRVPMPAMIFEVCYGGRRLTGSCCVVSGTYEEVREAYYAGNLVTYRYPFANVSKSGSICMGNIPYEVKKARDAHVFVDAFFDGVSNADYYDARERLRSARGQMEFLGSIEGEERFPLEELFEDNASGIGIPYERKH